MNLYFKKIKKLFEKPMQKIVYIRSGIRPIRDWMILLTTAVCAICLVAGLAYYLYVQIDNDTLFVSTEDATFTKEVAVDNGLLKKTLDRINAREAADLKLDTPKTGVVNPSI